MDSLRTSIDVRPMRTDHGIRITFYQLIDECSWRKLVPEQRCICTITQHHVSTLA